MTVFLRKNRRYIWDFSKKTEVKKPEVYLGASNLRWGSFGWALPSGGKDIPVSPQIWITFFNFEPRKIIHKTFNSQNSAPAARETSVPPHYNSYVAAPNSCTQNGGMFACEHCSLCSLMSGAVKTNVSQWAKLNHWKSYRKHISSEVIDRIGVTHKHRKSADTDLRCK